MSSIQLLLHKHHASLIHETLHCVKNGRWYWLLAQSCPQTPPSHEFLGLVGTVHLYPSIFSAGVLLNVLNIARLHQFFTFVREVLHT